MKRALLVNPWIYDFKAFDFFLKPLGLLYLASYLRQFGFEVSLLDCLDRNHPVLKGIKRQKVDRFGRGKLPSVVGEKPEVYKGIPRRYKRYGIPISSFEEILSETKEPQFIFVTSGMTYWYPGVFTAIKILKRRFPKVPVFLGGIYATLCPEHAQRNSGADFVIPGPFEENLWKYLPELPPLPFSRIPALAYDLYQKLDSISILTSRGCPFRCSYCAVPVLYPKFTYRDQKLVLKEMEYYLRLGVKNIAFFDDALLYHPQLKEILSELAKMRGEVNFHSPNGLHPRFIDEEIANLLYQANFKTVYLSLETVSPSLLKETGDKVKTEEFCQAVERLKGAGFKKEDLHAYLILGLPQQTVSDIKESIDFVLQLGIKCHLAEFSPIPGTKEYERLNLGKEIDPLLHNNTAFLYLKKREEILEMKRYLSQSQGAGKRDKFTEN